MADPLLATVADLGSLVDETLAVDNAKANLYLRIASGVVRGLCRQYLSFIADDVVTLKVIDGSTVFLKEHPVTLLTLVERKEKDGTFTTLAATDYELDEDTGRIQLVKIPWFDWATRWRVTYSHGYTEVPEPVSNATLGLASRAWETPIGVDNERIGQRSIKYQMLQSGLDPLEELQLVEYIRPEVR